MKNKLLLCGHTTDQLEFCKRDGCPTPTPIETIPDIVEGVFAPIRHLLTDEDIDKLIKSNLSKEIKHKLMGVVEP